jgi:hypothetical protein
MKVKELREILNTYSEDTEIFIENYEPFIVVELDGDVFLMTTPDDIAFDKNNYEE